MDWSVADGAPASASGAAASGRVDACAASASRIGRTAATRPTPPRTALIVDWRCFFSSAGLPSPWP